MAALTMLSIVVVGAAAAAAAAETSSGTPQWVINGLADQIYATMKAAHLEDLEPHALPEIARYYTYKGGEGQVFPNGLGFKVKLTDGVLRGLSTLQRDENATMLQLEDQLYQLVIPSSLTHLTFTMNARFRFLILPEIVFNVTGKMDALHFTAQFVTDGARLTTLQVVSPIYETAGLDLDLTMTSPQTCKFIDNVVKHFKSRLEKEVPSIANECLDTLYHELFPSANKTKQQ